MLLNNEQTITIRPAMEEDMDAFALLEARCFPDPWSRKGLRDTFHEEGSLFFTAEENGTVFGYLNASCIFDECNLNRICVLPEYRNRGVAAMLMKQMLDSCKEKRLSRIILEVRKSNLPAQAVYTRCGFSILGERANLYSNPPEAGLIMEYNLEGEHLD